MTPVEIEIDGERNESLYVRPLQRSIRGRFDLNRVGEPMARMKTYRWPVPILSQRIGIDQDGVGYLSEPLHDGAHAPIKERIEKQGQRLEPELQTFANIHQPTWLFWIKRAVQSGLARVVGGSLPDKIDGKPRMNFIVDRPAETTGERLTAAIERQTIVLEKLLERLCNE